MSIRPRSSFLQAIELAVVNKANYRLEEEQNNDDCAENGMGIFVELRHAERKLVLSLPGC
jgi:hypothetical protein